MKFWAQPSSQLILKETTVSKDDWLKKNTFKRENKRKKSSRIYTVSLQTPNWNLIPNHIQILTDHFLWSEKITGLEDSKWMECGDGSKEIALFSFSSKVFHLLPVIVTKNSIGYLGKKKKIIKEISFSTTHLTRIYYSLW